MNTRQKSIIGELLAGVDLAYCEEDLRELALCLRTATTYTEGLLALETEELRRKWLSAGPGDSEAVPDATSVKPTEVDVIVLLPSPKQNSVVNALRASVPVLSERAAMSVVQAAPIVLAVAGPHTSNLIKTLRAAGGNVELWPYSHATMPGIIHTSEVYQYFAALKPSTTAEVLPDETNLHGFPEGVLGFAEVLRTPAQPAKPSEECVVVLQSFPAPSRKMQVIKALRNAVRMSDLVDQFTGNHPSLLGWEQAKTIVESAPIVLATAGPHTEDLVRALREAGAQVDLLVPSEASGPLGITSCTETCDHFAALARET